MTMESLPRLGFGLASLGNLYRQVDGKTASATLEAAWESGIRYYDTAPHYGLGLAEHRLGEFLSDRARGDVVISTKVGRLLVADPLGAARRDLDNGYDVPASYRRVFDPSEAGIRRSLEESLQRLRVDQVDIAYLHDPDAYDLDRGLAEGLPALEQLRHEGIVGRIGIGTNSVEAALRAVREGDLDLVMIAGRYTLLEQPALAELLPLCLERNVGVVAVGVFNSGLLATQQLRLDAHYDYESPPAEMVAAAGRLAAICADYGVELPAVALQFPLRHPAVVSVLTATARPAQVRENVARFSVQIPDELWTRLATEGLAA